MTVATKKRQAGVVTRAADGPVVRACQVCAHYLPVEGEGAEGVCRRNPPLPFLLTNGNVRSVYPPVRGEWSCGAFAQRDPDCR